MCLAIPGKIIAIDSDPTLRMAEVDFGGISKSICIHYIEASLGDYILAHAGMAITRLDPEEAEATLADFQKIAQAFNCDENAI